MFRTLNLWVEVNKYSLSNDDHHVCLLWANYRMINGLEGENEKP